MIVDELRSEERAGAVQRSARVRWAGGSHRLRFSVPVEMSGPDGDGSPFLAAGLLQAMRRGEDLEIDAPVSARLVSRAEEAQTIYRSWAPSLSHAAVRTAGEAILREPAQGFACLLSRGVDSMYSVVAERPERFSHLVFVADLDPINDDRTRTEEVRLAQEVAGLLGKRLVVACTDLRWMADPVIDWSDLQGGGLAAIGHCLDGGISRLLVPSSSEWATMGPCGSSPVLDHLFSTETLAVEHGEMGSDRHGKIRFLLERRPELLQYLKVCYAENRPDNCGRCRKCLWTMLCLEAAGALELASGFPPRIDLQLVRDMRLGTLPGRLFWLDAARALDAAGRSEARDAVLHVLRRSARPGVRERLKNRWEALRGREPRHDPAVSRSGILFYRNQTNAALAVLRNGRPTP